MFFNKFARLTIAVALLVPAMKATSASAQALSVGISANIAPPPLPVYTQPAIPGPGYIWTPGYWAYGDAGYYWVPGTWVLPPQPGTLWTPGYWGFLGGAYTWNAGYWGPHVGFYGGVNYGFGYGGIGFSGGEWRGHAFFYNTAVANVGASISIGASFGGGVASGGPAPAGGNVTNVYVNKSVVANNTIVNNNSVSYNGGPDGVNHAPSQQEQQWSHENHTQPTSMQMQHQTFASQDRGQLASLNGGRPSTMTVPNGNAYQQMAAHNAQVHPITQADIAAGKSYNPNMRGANQDQRIANGLKSGQMTSGEAARAERNQTNLDQQVAADRAANGGKLTSQEQQQITKEQNANSQQIDNMKHNGATVAPSEVNSREANQEQRMANGERSGQMTSAETARASNRQANMSQQVHSERTANGGTLTQQQRQQANHQQNGASRQIYRQNHNTQTHKTPPVQQGFVHQAPGSGGVRHP